MLKNYNNFFFYRCKRIFGDDIKQTPVTIGDTKPVANATKQIAVMQTFLQTDKQKKDLEQAQKRHQIAAELIK